MRQRAERFGSLRAALRLADLPEDLPLWSEISAAAENCLGTTCPLFQDCFGVDYATAQQQLTAYLPEAIRDRLPLRPASRPRLPAR